jgi:carbonic anhydrase
MSEKATFACAINCMDGRVQIPVTDWLSACLDVDYIDMVTEPGADRVLASGSKSEIESILKRVMISVNVHKSRAVAIIAHYDCAGNPVPQKEHIKFLEQCVKVIRSWGLPVRVVALWVNEEWAVEVVSDTHKKE